METDEITITFDVLYDTLRKEKHANPLQPLDPQFHAHVVAYLNDKQHLLETKKNDHGLFGFEEKNRITAQIENVRKMLSELYDIRERKIIGLARDISRTQGKITNDAEMLPEEEMLFEEMLALFDAYRKNVLYRVLDRQLPDVVVAPSISPLPTTPATIPATTPEPTEEPKPLKTDPEPIDQNVLIRFTESVKRFMGPNLEKYGPYEPNQEASLPRQIADILLKRGWGIQR